MIYDTCTRCANNKPVHSRAPMCAEFFNAHWDELGQNIRASRSGLDQSKYRLDKPRDSMGLSQVYRHFDINHNLLYIGVTFSAFQRLAQHKSQSHWFNRISYITIEWFDTREEAEKAELEAIKSEQSKFNKGYVEGWNRWA